jgi:diguanylate cyclase (GGDEF)-like protein
MSLLRAPEVLESAVQVTQEREEAHLRRSLLRTLQELMPESVALMLGVEHDDRDTPRLATYGAREPARGAFRRLLEAHEALLWEVIRSREPRLAELDNGRRIYLCPVDGRRPEGELLAVDLGMTEPENLRVIGAFARLYSNFNHLVNESERDRLTGLLNRRSFDVQLARVISGDEDPEAPRGLRRGAWLALFDKRINDSFGHLYGDEVLLLLARIVQRNFRNEDRSYRYGGEEFALVIRGSCPEAAAIALERLRQQVEAYDFPQVCRVTISIGYAALEPMIGPTDLIGRADRALYAAKGGGRNRVVSFEDLRRAEPQTPPRVGEIELF